MMTTERIRPKRIASHTPLTAERTNSGLIVVIGHVHVRRQILFQFTQYLLEFTGNIERAAIRLAAYVEQYGGAALGADHVEDRFRTALNTGEIAHTNRMTIHHCQRQVGDFRRRMHPSVHHREVQCVVLLVHAGGFENIVARTKNR